MRIITEPEFRERLIDVLRIVDRDEDIFCVTGPGRSGAVAAVYTSHMLRIPFIPYGNKAPTGLGKLLIIDTARESGATLRKAVSRYEKLGHDVVSAVCFEEPPRVAFWYEADKPQFYRHEKKNVNKSNPLELAG